MTDDIRTMEVSGCLCTLTSAGLVGIESSRNIYVPTTKATLDQNAPHPIFGSSPEGLDKAQEALVAEVTTPALKSTSEFRLIDEPCRMTCLKS